MALLMLVTLIPLHTHTPIQNSMLCHFERKLLFFMLPETNLLLEDVEPLNISSENHLYQERVKSTGWARVGHGVPRGGWTGTSRRALQVYFANCQKK